MLARQPRSSSTVAIWASAFGRQAVEESNSVFSVSSPAARRRYLDGRPWLRLSAARGHLPEQASRRREHVHSYGIPPGHLGPLSRRAARHLRQRRGFCLLLMMPESPRPEAHGRATRSRA